MVGEGLSTRVLGLGVVSGSSVVTYGSAKNKISSGFVSLFSGGGSASSDNSNKNCDVLQR